ncbi:MAG TPA: peptidase T [Candidatus Lokiarchaeia archaeon]|nr:peptidase T [Candidatus Lokiarchaeia archaeon]
MESSHGDVLDRFLRYVRVYTTSQEDVQEIPSTPRQFDLARLLVQELNDMGMDSVELDDHCIIYGTLATNLPEETAARVPIVCFIAHLDTSPEEPGENVQPLVVTYTGGDLTYPNNPDLAVTVEDSPVLSDLEGEMLVTSDGTTLLGADDKAGVAEIMAAVSFLLQHPDIPHGTIKIVFSPDEEVNHSVDFIDVQKIGADFGYTLDGDELGTIEAECFNAVSGNIVIQGYNVHPGYAYGKMVNAARVMADILKLFPDEIAPETTRDREGYYHPAHVQGSVNEAKMDFLLRDFDQGALQEKIEAIRTGVAEVQAKYPGAKINLEFKEGYHNMKEIMDQHPRVTEIADEAIRRLSVEPRHKEIRGGTDGARLCFMGLPCPNLFAGGMNFHSKKEFVPVRWMEQAVQMILNIVEITSKEA